MYKSPLQRAPGELRLDIYELALKEDIKLEPCAWASTKLQCDAAAEAMSARFAASITAAADYLRKPMRLTESEKPAGLQLACQQVRDECWRLRPSTVTIKVFHFAWAADLTTWTTEVFRDLVKMGLDRRMNIGWVTVDLGYLGWDKDDVHIAEGAPRPGPENWFLIDAIRALVSKQAKFEIVITLRYRKEFGRREHVRHQMVLPLHDPKAVRPSFECALETMSDLILVGGGRHTPCAVQWLKGWRERLGVMVGHFTRSEERGRELFDVVQGLETMGLT